MSTTERALLATLMANPEEITEVSPIVRPEDFTLANHEAIFAEMLAMVAKGTKIDAVTLSDSLAASGHRITFADLADLSLAEGGSGACVPYARAIREASQRRDMWKRLQTALEAVADPGRPLVEVAGLAEAAAMAGTDRAETTEKMIWELMPEVFQMLEDQSNGTITGLKTGLRDLDAHLSGLQKGDLIVIGGRPAMGKTSLATDIAGSVAIDQRLSLCFFTLEMPSKQIAMRHLLTRAKVNGQLLRKGRLPKSDYPRLQVAAPQFGKETRWMMDGATSLSPLRILSKVRRHRAKYGLDLIVIDNIQKMQSDTRQKDKRLEVAEITCALKNMAKDLDVPIIAISHLSRGVDHRSDPEPGLADLQESGNIEQDADIVLFVYRESVYKEVPPEEEDQTKLIIAKYRNGQTGHILLRFNRDLSSFESLETHREAPPESWKDRQSNPHGDFYGNDR